VSLRARLILVFLAATLVPLGATWWIGNALLERSLSYAGTDQLDQLSRVVEQTGRALYRQARHALQADAEAGRIPPQRFRPSDPAVQDFWAGGEPSRFALTGAEGDRLSYFLRRPGEVLVYSAPIGPPGMTRLSEAYRQARETVERDRGHDLRRGFLYTFALLAAGVWLISLALLVVTAHRITRPIRGLTAALGRLAAGDLAARVEEHRRGDEIGRAIFAFNDMAAQLLQSRDRLVYLTQMASWQLLARKMAHELKNSLTPIRLTMEEVLARRGPSGDAFLEQAARIIIDEAESLERRVRAFSQFAAEPPVNPAPLDVNATLEERVAFLGNAHPEVSYAVQFERGLPPALADTDHHAGILTNLLENAAEAAGPGGRVLAITRLEDGAISIEVHDSGPGLGEEARRSLFEPTISFKKGGMGLGLSIARKNALLMSGDLSLAQPRLRGAAFRLSLPAAAPAAVATA
jgi:two-component system nitrogen regulation sensor histidine kinase NtrY